MAASTIFDDRAFTDDAPVRAPQRVVAQKQHAVSQVTSPLAQMGTARLLEIAWFSLIPSLGLSLLYLNFHAFCAHLLHSSSFCKLGQEWSILRQARALAAGEAVNGASATSTFTGMIEGMLLIGLDLMAATMLFFLYLLVQCVVNFSIMQALLGNFCPIPTQ